jgi:hypothetical protein
VGIIGFIFFIFLLARTFQAIMHSLNMAKNDFQKCLAWGAFGSLCGAVFHSMLEPNFEGAQFSVIIWIIIGLAAKLPKLASIEAPPRPTSLH